MSATRDLMAALQKRLGADDPLPPPPPVPVIPSPPHRVFPSARTPHTRSRYAERASAHTTASTSPSPTLS